ncbi:MAG: SBBP repeat-containing protein, partial [Bacteroidia bacterium]|nr:SBBP repeat-containing protein [Bacteroidia bacterium]
MKKFILLTELTFSKIPSPHTKGQRLSSFFLTLVICLLQFSYVSAQNYQWAKAIGSTYTDYGNSIAVDDTGNVYITGDFQSTADFNPGTGIANLTPVGYKDIFIAKYAPNGNSLWAKNIGSTYI